MYKSLGLFLLVLLALGSTSAEVTDDCLACMCWASSNCTMKDPVCQIHDWGEVCGPWAITQPYWIDGGYHDGDFYTCVTEWPCNEATVRGYLARYVPSPDASCEDYSRTHVGGPLGASQDSTLSYWYSVKDCLDYGLFTPPTLL